MWCSSLSPSPCSTTSSKIESSPFAPAPIERQRCHRGGGDGACVLLRPARPRPGGDPEDLLHPRPARDRVAVRVRRGRGDGDPPPAQRGPVVGHALLRGGPPVDRLRGRDACNRLDLGKGVVGPLVGLERAGARVVLDRVPSLLLLSAASLLDRGSRAAGPLRVGVRRHRRGVRPRQLPRGATRDPARPPARPVAVRQPPRADAPDVPRLARRRRAAVGDAVEARAQPQELADELEAPARAARGPRRGRGARPRGRGQMTTVLASASGHYVAAAYVVFVALILLYLVIIAVRAQRTERELRELSALAEKRPR